MYQVNCVVNVVVLVLSVREVPFGGLIQMMSMERTNSLRKGQECMKHRTKAYTKRYEISFRLCRGFMSRKEGKNIQGVFNTKMLSNSLKPQ